MRIAVTGATGFIGRYVSENLRTRGFDPLLVGRSIPTKRTHRHVVMDICDPPSDAFDQLDRPDIVVHLAWGGLPNYLSPHHFEHELPRHYRFLKDLVQAGLTNLVVTGTCFEYGMQSGPLSESSPVLPENAYGFAKDALRKQLQFLQVSAPFNLVWARLFYPYGEGQARTSLLPQLKLAVEQGNASFNMSGGEQLRDFMPVEELANDLVSLALLRRDVGIVNVCSGTPISVRTLVESWIRQNGWNIELNLGHYPYAAYEPMAFWGDATKLRRSLEP